MLVKSITYTDFDGQEKTEDFYFNLTSAECVDLQLSVGGGFADVMVEAVETEDKAKIVSIFKELISRSYGVRTGGNFFKTPEHAAAFATTEAYSALFMDLIENEGAAISFFKGVMPAELLAKADAMSTAEVREKLNLPKSSKLNEQFEEQQAARAQRPKRPRTKEELLAAFREKNAPKKPDWLNMTEAEAMQLPEEQFYEWLNAQPEATQA